MRTLAVFAILCPLFAQPVVVTFPNANVYVVPLVSRIYSGNVDFPTGGGYFKGVESGATTIVANIDTTNQGQTALNMPSFRVTIDSNASAVVQESVGATQVTLASGLSGTHAYLVQILGANTTVGNCWTGLPCHTIINSLQFEAGTVLSPPTVKPKLCFVEGDSYLMSVIATSQVGAWYNYIDYTQSWPQILAGQTSLNCEMAQRGIGSQGWMNPGNGNYPAFPASWNQSDATHTMDLTAIPDYYFVAIGVNDHVGSWSTSQIDSAITTWHTALRATTGWGSVRTFVVIPFADASDAVNHAQIAATIQSFGGFIDTAISNIDLRPEWACLPFSGGATSCSFDGMHPDVPTHALIASDILKQIPILINGVPQGTPATSLAGQVSISGQVTIH